MANFILNQSSVPTVLSTSYGSIEIAEQAELAMCVTVLLVTTGSGGTGGY